MEFSISVVKEQADKKDIRLIFDYTYNPSVVCEGNMIQTAIRRLLSNAIKFSPSDSKVYVFVTDYTDPGQVAISIRDNGQGMTEETIHRILNRG